MHEDLLSLALDLARREPGRPRQVSLRRAVSTAYYAVFHSLARACADELVGWSKPWDVVAPVYRLIDHGAARRVFDRIRQDAGRGPELAKLARVFIQLQEARHTADYDPRPFVFGRSATLDLIEQARQALAIVQSMPGDERLRLAVNLVTKSR